MAIRILICDDDAFTRGAVESILTAEPGFDVVATATPADAIDQAMTSRPQVALIGSDVDDGHGLDLIRWFGTNLPGCRCVVVGPQLMAEDVGDYRAAGAVAVPTKGRTSSDVLATIRLIAVGEVDQVDLTCTAPADGGRAVTRPFPDLTHTDRRMLQLVARGLTNSQIAATLHYSRHTVRNRMSRLFRIMGVSNRTQLALIAQQQFRSGG